MPADIATGILLHRQIDAFTDRHPINNKLRHLFPQHLQRYRGICLDLFWDYCLSQAWQDFHHQPKLQFIQRHYATLELDLPELRRNYPSKDLDRAAWVFARMIQHDWLSSYAEIDNISIALKNIGKRFRQPQPLQEAADLLTEHERIIQEGFAEFFPDLVTYSKTVAHSQKS